jgi:hypothetical protein
MTTLTKEALFKSRNQAQQIAYCVVMEPDTVDLQDDTAAESEIEKTAHDYLLNARVVGDSHKKNKDGTIVKADAGVVESFIAPVDFQMGSELIRKGSWVVAIKVNDPGMWSAIDKGEITGVSIGGFGERVPA